MEMEQLPSREAFLARWNSIPTVDTVVPIIDPEVLTTQEECSKAVVNSLETLGLVIWRSDIHHHLTGNERVRMQVQTAKFFDLPNEVKEATVNPAFQGGWTRPFTEKPQDVSSWINTLAPDQRPFVPQYEKDPKDRYMSGIGTRRASTRFPKLTPPTRILPGHENWHRNMDEWGNCVMWDVEEVLRHYFWWYDLRRAEVVRLKRGAHLVAPTGTDLRQYPPGTVVADTHGDMGVLSIHEPSVAVFYRPPKNGRKGAFMVKPCGGLIVWTRDGRMLRVVVPEGCRLIQAGFQFTHITDGRVPSGMHQVVVPPIGEEYAKLAAERDMSVQRISATLFVHLDADTRAHVPECFRTPGKVYPKTWAGQLDMDVLDKIYPQQP